MILDLAIIPARGGSKGLPGKNLRMLGGIPLIGWTIRSAVESGLFRRVIVSTDSTEIARAAELAGAEIPFMRPAELANDNAGSIEVVEHALTTCGVSGNFALLQPTSPFRNAEHLRKAAALFAARAPAAVVGVLSAKPISWNFVVDDKGSMSPIANGQLAARRQDSLPIVQPNGSLYITSTATFEQTRSLIPPEALAFPMSQIASLDIDTIGDARIAEGLVAIGAASVDA
ncbi:acylneuraminate cytidylyltransferase family protein [Tsuneonella sp. HG249]